jgi:hypothetical protein
MVSSPIPNPKSYIRLEPLTYNLVAQHLFLLNTQHWTPDTGRQPHILGAILNQRQYHIPDFIYRRL